MLQEKCASLTIIPTTAQGYVTVQLGTDLIYDRTQLDIYLFRFINSVCLDAWEARV